MGEPVGFIHIRTLILLLVVVASAEAHEIGTTRVSVSFHDAKYRIDVVTPPRTLLRAHGDLARVVEIRFGEVRSIPRVAFLADDTIRFTGDIPHNAGPFTWRFPLVYSTYSLALPNGVQWVEGEARSSPFSLPSSRLAVIRQYLQLGFTHILPHGFDHILFVLGLFLLSTRWKPLLSQVTAFTIAHSITLGLTMYGVVSISPRIVEPAIALSIAYVAVENVMTTQLKPWRVGIVFAFGLLHGMGFAGVLRELGLPRSQFLTALITFNVGVELGQLAVIATAFLLVAQWYRAKPWYRQRLVVPASALIAATGVFWTVQRLM